MTEFTARRWQSFAGFVFLLFLFEHLLTNSQAALFVGDDGRGFISSVNFIHSLPYLPVIELLLIALPAGIHVWIGMQRIFTYKANSFPSDGSRPFLPYARNHAFTAMRLTSWFLLIALCLHVGYMRFLKQPREVGENGYSVVVTTDPGLEGVAKRLATTLHKEGPDEVRLESPDVGTAFLFVLRDTYKSILLSSLYSLFVIIASFHACNGLWTFAITWGITLTERARLFVRRISNVLMALLIFLGLACIWGVYWINLRY